MESLYTCLCEDPGSRARVGVLDLPHGKVSTPVFMPVGTNGTVKAVRKDELEEIGCEIILANTYHLYLRPGMEVIGAAGGLHSFMGWDRNILTDSGGFQVFSLSKLRKITEEGVAFKSHIDGSSHMLTPESVVDIQAALGSDIQMQLDVCSSWGAERREAEQALELTHRWLARAKAARLQARPEYRGSLFAIVQGNFFQDLRTRSAELVVQADTPGIAIGGLSVGEPFPVFAEFLAHTAALLPKEKPRYVMGIGTPEFILEAIGEGIDMFDCVFPTRTARNGLVFTHAGPLSLKKEQNKFDQNPIDAQCACSVCRRYSRSYLRHLFKTGEILCSMLASYHNLYFLHDLVLEARKAILAGTYSAFKAQFLSRYSDAGSV